MLGDELRDPVMTEGGEAMSAVRKPKRKPSAKEAAKRAKTDFEGDGTEPKPEVEPGTDFGPPNEQ